MESDAEFMRRHREMVSERAKYLASLPRGLAKRDEPPSPQTLSVAPMAAFDRDEYERTLRIARARIEIEEAMAKQAADVAAEKAEDFRSWRKNSALPQFITAR